MKKSILTLFILLFFSVTAWSAEHETSESSSVESAGDSAVSSQETTESTLESPETSTDTSGMETTSTSTDIEQEKPEHGFGHKLLFYIPNRILDVFDIVRLRARVGPGIAIGARVTKPLSFFFGGYGTVFVGLPGPRLEPIVKLPVGLENYGGLSFSLLDSTNEGRFAPNYSPTEIGVSLHLLIAGFDVTVDPVEVIDLAAGLIFIDIRDDDL